MKPLRALAGALPGCWIASAAAHGFGQRFDLPLPLWLWVTGAGVTIVLTFVTIAIFVRDTGFTGGYPRVNLLRFAPIRWFIRPAIVGLVRLLAVVLFVVSVCAGFFGVQDPYSNLITTMVWVVWWVGCAFVCALIGDIWALANPLRTIFAWFERLYAWFTGGRALARELPYPASLGVWPGVALFFGFAWAELIWQQNDVPIYLARALLCYAAATWIGMFLFGRESWLAAGETFSIAFGILSRFAPIEASKNELNLRPPGAGLMAERQVSVSFLVFVVLMLASVTFDGFLETPLNQRVSTAVQQSPTMAAALFELSERGLEESQVIATAALAAFALGFLAVYWLASWTTARLARRRLSAREVGCSFVLTLVPIAVAYHLSHYFSLLMTAGQFVIPLVSDPFGFGWNLFGTAQYKVDLGILSPYVFWYSAVTLIVIGHVVAVVLAHIATLRVFGSRRDAFVSQVPMVILMVAYTMLSLWILAQPIVG